MNILALSPGEYGHTILQDIGLICFIAVIFAGLIHAWLQKTSPNLQWNKIGSVNISGLGAPDIVACVVMVGYFSLGIILPYKDPSGVEVSPLNLMVHFGILMAMAAIVFAIYNQRGMLPDAMGLQPKHPAQVITWAVAAYIVFFMLNILLSQAGLEQWLTERLGDKQNQQIVDELIHSQENQKRLIMILGACVIAPFAEEIIFRGYLYPVVKRYTEPVVAALFTGIIFGAVHGEVWAVIHLSLFGVLLALLYEASGSIWACILCHGMFNTINVFFMLTMGDQL